jgi:NAD(P)H-hydrate epimerase
MVLRPLTREEVRTIDARAAGELGLATLVLMENAGRGAADWLRELASPGSRIVIACGPGNNGGDGGVVARHLDAEDFPVRVVCFADPTKLSHDAAVQHALLERSGIDQENWRDPSSEQLDALFASADWIVDGLLGTGLTRTVEGPLRTAIEAMNRSGKPVLALDLPSGLDADTGQPLGVAVRARATATFAASKVGFTKAGAEAYTGPVRVFPIGVPRRLLEEFRRP